MALTGPISIEDARRQVGVLDASEDESLSLYALAALEWCAGQTGLDLSVTCPVMVKVSALLLVGEFFLNREAGSMSEVAQERALDMVRPYRALTA